MAVHGENFLPLENPIYKEQKLKIIHLGYKTLLNDFINSTIKFFPMQRFILFNNRFLDVDS